MTMRDARTCASAFVGSGSVVSRQGTALAAEGVAIPGRHQSHVGTYFVISRSWQSRPLFVTDPMRSVFIDSLLPDREERCFSLHALVLMPDHFHILLTPAANKSLEGVVQCIKGGSARKLALERNLRFPVWQRDFATHIRYIDENPVRKKLVLEPREYRWSSASRAYSLDALPQWLNPTRQEVALRQG